MRELVKVNRRYVMRDVPEVVVTVLYLGRIDITMGGFNRSTPAVHFIRHVNGAVITAMPTDEFLKRFELEEVDR